jgi:hypothetical protein
MTEDEYFDAVFAHMAVARGFSFHPQAGSIPRRAKRRIQDRIRMNHSAIVRAWEDGEDAETVAKRVNRR